MLDELQRKAEAATPGPWYVGSTRARGQEVLIDAPGDPRLRYGSWKGMLLTHGCDDAPEIGAKVAQANAAYIASASPDVVLRLIAVARAAKAMLAPTGENDTTAEVALRESLAALEAVGKKEGMDDAAA